MNPKDTDCKPTQEQPEWELKEKLAAIEHERWADWQKWLHGMCIEMKVVAPESNDMTYQAMAFPKKLYDKWERQIKTPYSKLSGEEKGSDLEQVDRYWPLIQKYITQALLTERERLYEEVGKMKCDERKTHYFGQEPNCYGAQTYDEKMLVNAVIQAVQNIIKPKE